MSELIKSRKTPKTVLAGMLSIALSGCGSGAAAPKQCQSFSDKISPHHVNVVETGTTQQGTYVYFIANNVGSISVAQTLQTSPKNINASQPAIQVETMKTNQPGSITLREPDHTEMITISGQANPSVESVGFHSDYCMAPQSS